MWNIFISLSNILAVSFQQPFSKNKVNEIIIYKVLKQTHKGYYGDDSYTIDCVNSMNHYHSNSYGQIV